MAEQALERDELFTGCFGCGRDNPIGLKLEFRVEGDAVRADFSFDQRYVGYDKFIHGGIIATVLDEAMGWALVELAGSYGVTRKLSVEYRRPVTMGRPMTVRARIVERDKTRITIEAYVEDQRSRLLASASGEWVLVRRERARAS